MLALRYERGWWGSSPHGSTKFEIDPRAAHVCRGAGARRLTISILSRSRQALVRGWLVVLRSDLPSARVERRREIRRGRQRADMLTDQNEASYLHAYLGSFFGREPDGKADACKASSIRFDSGAVVHFSGGEVAMARHHVCTVALAGSNPVASTIFRPTEGLQTRGSELRMSQVRVLLGRPLRAVGRTEIARVF